MRDLFPDDENYGSWKTWLRRFFLDLDSRIDFGLYQAKTWGRELFERYSDFMDRFHVAGWRRWYFVEPLSECLSLGTGGFMVMLALAIPAFRETADDDWLKKSELAVTFLDRYGNEVGYRGIKHNDALRLDEFPDHLIKATLATEDRRFYEHFGIDIPGLFRAMTANARAGGVVQGGSSISQQLAKNLFLSNERTIERKVKEAFLALWLEARLPKNEILKLYLDRAYLGGGTFGVDAAAQYYFNKSARDVNLSEAAMLAGLFKAPSKFAPHINLPAARARANVVLDNLVDAGFMTEGQVFGARRNPATAVDRRDERSPNYYLDWAFDEIKKLAASLPKSVHERVFVVRLALDVDLQKHAEQAVENSIRQYGREYNAHQGAYRPDGYDGAVRAMVGGRDYAREPVQSRHRRVAPAGLVLQALCLCHGADERLQADLHRGQLACLHRQLVPEELRRRLRRRHDTDGGPQALRQYHCGEAFDLARQWQRQDRARENQGSRPQGRFAHPSPRHALDADRGR